jgi:hypothetical protein
MDAEDRKPGGEGGIRARPFFEPSCYQGDGENPYKHSHSNTISFPSYLSNVAWFNCISVFLELMELMHSSLFQRKLHAADAAAAARRAFHALDFSEQDRAWCVNRGPEFCVVLDGKSRAGARLFGG